ncbi:hypothetical protein [Pseudomonas sp. SWRI154]|uniref:hypothetical protein n=1 Tax=Pseudomonas sp. SWRI154 TaxID=2745501 RepID=UPI0016484AC5|nr:hypothetical protein [Pseudomonas sp. SWRI154]MBC3366158.1 hypothetical protein [Pseudomonas sp. SWRI154]
MKNLILALLLGPVAAAVSLADTNIIVKIANHTSKDLEMSNLSGEFSINPDFSDIPAKKNLELHFKHDRKFTYPLAGWQPKLREIKPIELVLTYQMTHFNFGCQMQTLFEAPVVFGILTPSYKPNWQSRTAYTGNGEYTCRSEITQKMLEPPFSYTIHLVIDENNPT